MFKYSLLTGISAILLAGIFAFKILSRKVKSNKMQTIADSIKAGANAYIFRQIKAIALITPILVVALYFLFDWQTAVASLLGVVTSLTAAFIGMSICVRTNLRTADAAGESPMKAFQTAVFGGAVMGLCVTGMSLLILSILFMLFNKTEYLVGFGFGASLAALFAQIGGGIFTKSADIGADLVGKVEKGIPEDDPRNAAVIADLVGDNVGDCAGRGSDLFQTFSDDIVTGSLVAVMLVPHYGIKALYFPILLQSVGVISSAIGILFARPWSKKLSATAIFNIGLILTALLSYVGSYFLTKYIFGDIKIWVAVVLGIATTLVASASTRYYAGMGWGPVNDISEASKAGPALNLITGLAYGLQSPIVSILMIVGAIILAYNFTGGMLFAIVAVNIGTDLLIGYIISADSFGPIVDNSAGIAEMSKAPEKVVRSLSRLDSVGNTMKAITKSYSMSSGTVTAFVIFATFFSLTRIRSFDVASPFSLGFMLIGVSLPFLIASIVIGSTAKTAKLMVEEVRRQFHVIKGLMTGKVLPDYAKCVDIATTNALREMIIPGVLSIITPVAVGFLFGAKALGALLIGSVISAALLGPFLNNLGTALDNAKKTIEDRRGGKGSFEHAAAVVGDTVGDPLKDVAGPALLIFMKLIGMTALLVAPLLVR